MIKLKTMVVVLAGLLSAQFAGAVVVDFTGSTKADIWYINNHNTWVQVDKKKRSSVNVAKDTVAFYAHDTVAQIKELKGSGCTTSNGTLNLGQYVNKVEITKVLHASDKAKVPKVKIKCYQDLSSVSSSQLYNKKKSYCYWGSIEPIPKGEIKDLEKQGELKQGNPLPDYIELCREQR